MGKAELHKFADKWNSVWDKGRNPKTVKEEEIVEFAAKNNIPLTKEETALIFSAFSHPGSPNQALSDDDLEKVSGGKKAADIQTTHTGMIILGFPGDFD